MCGIFSGYNINHLEIQKGIELIKKGNDGITYIESQIINNYSKYGTTDTDIFKNISQEVFK